MLLRMQPWNPRWVNEMLTEPSEKNLLDMDVSLAAAKQPIEPDSNFD